MAVIIARWADGNLQKYGKKLLMLQKEFPQALPRVINQVGARAKTQVVRNLTKQTGLPRATIVQAVGDPTRAYGGKLTYEMRTRGGQIRLKYLSPIETRAGVTAKPWGQRTLFPGTFLKGGAFPNRKVVAKFDGHVYRRIGFGLRTDDSVGDKLTQARSGMAIPTEMTVGVTRAAFMKTAGPLLQQRVDALIGKLLK